MTLQGQVAGDAPGAPGAVGQGEIEVAHLEAVGLFRVATNDGAQSLDG